MNVDFSQRWTVGNSALKLISDAAGASLILILSDINMPGMTGLETIAEGQGSKTGRPSHHDHGLWRP
jgi:CheY-like chemotaxis protein